jgi:hypothetical protein
MDSMIEPNRRKGSGGYAAYQLGMMQKITFYIVA